MINVQATRKSTVETAPGREDYEEKQDRSRRFVPLIFLLIVGSCTAYLKSFLPMKLGASEDREKVRGSGEEENLKAQLKRHEQDSDGKELGEVEGFEDLAVKRNAPHFA